MDGEALIATQIFIYQQLATGENIVSIGLIAFFFKKVAAFDDGASVRAAIEREFDFSAKVSAVVILLLDSGSSGAIYELKTGFLV